MPMMTKIVPLSTAQLPNSCRGAKRTQCVMPLAAQLSTVKTTDPPEPFEKFFGAIKDYATRRKELVRECEEARKARIAAEREFDACVSKPNEPKKIK